MRNIYKLLTILTILFTSFSASAEITEEIEIEEVKYTSNKNSSTRHFDDRIIIPRLDISSTVENILPTVVSISIENDESQTKRKPNGELTATGSGFIISKDGYIVTNNHVIEGADEITVILNETNEKFGADVIGFDKTTDLALLKIKSPKELPYVSFDTSNTYKAGDWVIVVGNPFNLGVSVSTGIISAKNRNIGIGTFDNFIQTDAAINRGNSGGPMFNLEGEVIGINSAIFSPSGGSVGVGFAIPSSTVLPIVQKIKQDGFVKRSWLGITGQDVTKEISKSLNMRSAYGVIITDISSNSPASTTGLLQSDVILYIGRTKINNTSELHKVITETKTGSTALIKILRRGKVIKVSTIIGESKEEDNYNGEYESIAGEAINFLGIKMVIIGNKTRSYFGLDKNTKGIYVMKVQEGSVAEYNDIREGDIIHSINQKPIQTKLSFNTLIKNVDKNNRDYLLLLIKRSGNIIVETLPLKSNLIENKTGFN
jgi:serine protease Do